MTHSHWSADWPLCLLLGALGDLARLGIKVLSRWPCSSFLSASHSIPGFTSSCCARNRQICRQMPPPGHPTWETSHSPVIFSTELTSLISLPHPLQIHPSPQKWRPQKLSNPPLHPQGQRSTCAGVRRQNHRTLPLEGSLEIVGSDMPFPLGRRCPLPHASTFTKSHKGPQGFQSSEFQNSAQCSCHNCPLLLQGPGEVTASSSAP